MKPHLPSISTWQNQDFVTDLNNYADYSHYKPEINRYMVECFADGACEIKSSEQMAAELSRMKIIVEGFDFDGLFEKYR